MRLQEIPDLDNVAALRARSAPGDAGLSRRKPGLVLLVEDDFVLRSSLSEFLAGEGFRVDCCADGREAFRRLHAQPRPDVILLDIMLPHLDGFELRALQMKSPLLADIPVVVISAYDLDPQSITELHLPTLFHKPLDTEKLVAKLRELTAPVS
jgi:CheY-like chemotaxis protein